MIAGRRSSSAQPREASITRPAEPGWAEVEERAGPDDEEDVEGGKETMNARVARLGGSHQGRTSLNPNVASNKPSMCTSFAPVPKPHKEGLSTEITAKKRRRLTGRYKQNAIVEERRKGHTRDRETSKDCKETVRMGARKRSSGS